MEGGSLDRGGVMKYSPGVLVGNWQEQSRLREEELMDYKARKAALLASGMAGSSRQKSIAAAAISTSAANAIEEHDMLVAKRLTEPTRITPVGESSVVRFGAPVMIVNVKHHSTLAVDLSQSTAPGPQRAVLTCSPMALPQVRSTWVLEPCRDENNTAYRTRVTSHDVVHYGQRVRIANETASEEGFYYVHAELESGQYSSLEQRATAALGARGDNVFVVCKPGARREAVEIVGEPVSLGAPVILLHSLTNRPLCVKGGRVKTGCYGMELAVTCDYANGGNFTHVRSGVAAFEENQFYFTADGEEDGPVLRKSRTASMLADTAPAPSEDGIEDLLGSIRETMLRVGGRLGFRAVSRALGVAGTEKRRNYLNHMQLQSFLSDKLGVHLNPLELDALIKRFDKSGQNVVCAQELVAELRGNMTAERLAAVVLVHNQLIMEGEGSVEFKNMFNLYRTNAARHPDVLNGSVSREQVILDFESSWPGRVGTKIGTVTLDEFVEYYNDISPAFIDDDSFFTMLRNCWAIPATSEYMKGIPKRHITVTHTNDTLKTIQLPDTLVLDASDHKAIERILIRHGVKDIKSFAITP